MDKEQEKKLIKILDEAQAKQQLGSGIVYTKFVKTIRKHVEGEIIENPPGKYPGVYFNIRTEINGQKLFEAYRQFKVQILEENPKFMDIAEFEAGYTPQYHNIKKGQKKVYAIAENSESDYNE